MFAYAILDFQDNPPVTAEMRAKGRVMYQKVLQKVVQARLQGGADWQ